MSFHAKRSRQDEELDRAIALSLADAPPSPPPPPPPPPSDEVDDSDLEGAIAASLTEPQPTNQGSWDCRVCTLSNSTEQGRCAACGSDRTAPYASKAPNQSAQAEWRCGLPGCSRPRSHFEFCCQEHQQRAASRGLLAPTTQSEDRIYCGANGEFACALLTNKSEERASVIAQFRKAWRKPEPTPRVERVYAVRPKSTLVERYATYKAAVSNERRRFHGTGSACDFAIDDQVGPCASRACALCSILSDGFRLEHAGTGPNAGRATFGTAAGLRYGRGIYFSSTSGKSNDYNGGSERQRRGRRWRTLFVCRVAAGQAFLTQEGEHNFTRPPHGYDSVVGEVGPNLNYDELVVYTEAAALPEFLLVVSFDA